MSCEKNHVIVPKDISKTEFFITTNYVCEKCGMTFTNIKRLKERRGEYL